ncbi:histidine phosphatase family protein [Georgenia sp. H159]|uniref:histidine phosphatase family protein n=1 Tax=Georgenia sp. H159 TaxID=3076115 RepID=UPI002D7735A8|nr:histidine phosphatase family protein [Georgenia sp. H159]
MNQASLFDTEPAAAAPGTDRPSKRAGRSTRVLVVEADGGSRGNPGPAGYGALVREGDTVLAERAEFLGVCSNNVAEYSGLIAGLRAAAAIDPTARVEVRMDSKLVVEQMSGNWKIKHADMRRLALEAREIVPAGQVTYTWIPRALNGAADALANAVMDSGGQIVNDYDYDDDGAQVPTSSGSRDAGPVADESDDDVVPIPDVDTNAPSLADPDAITLVLVSPGVAPRDRDGDPELSEQGIELAGAAAALVDMIGDGLWPHLARPSVLLASPLVRALQTAELISEVADLGVPTVDDDFAPAQPGESRAEMAARVERALERLDDGSAGCTVVIAAHADVIAAIVGTVVAAPTDSWEVFRIAPGTVSVMRRWSGRGEVHVIGAPAAVGED